jgi:hypothetical protein
MVTYLPYEYPVALRARAPSLAYFVLVGDAPNLPRGRRVPVIPAPEGKVNGAFWRQIGSLRHIALRARPAVGQDDRERTVWY